MAEERLTCGAKWQRQRARGEARGRWATRARLLRAGGPSELAGLLLRARGPAGGSEVMGWLVGGLGRLGREAE